MFYGVEKYFFDCFWNGRAGHRDVYESCGDSGVFQKRIDFRLKPRSVQLLFCKNILQLQCQVLSRLHTCYEADGQ